MRPFMALSLVAVLAQVALPGLVGHARAENEAMKQHPATLVYPDRDILANGNARFKTCEYDAAKGESCSWVGNPDGYPRNAVDRRAEELETHSELARRISARSIVGGALGLGAGLAGTAAFHSGTYRPDSGGPRRITSLELMASHAFLGVVFGVPTGAAIGWAGSEIVNASKGISQDEDANALMAIRQPRRTVAGRGPGEVRGALERALLGLDSAPVANGKHAKRLPPEADAPAAKPGAAEASGASAAR